MFRFYLIVVRGRLSLSGGECVRVSQTSARVCSDSGPGDGLRVPVCRYVDIQSPVSPSADGLRVPRNVQCQQCMWAAPGSLQPSGGGMRLPSPATSQEPRLLELSTKSHNIRRRCLPTGTPPGWIYLKWGHMPAKLIIEGRFGYQRFTKID